MKEPCPFSGRLSAALLFAWVFLPLLFSCGDREMDVHLGSLPATNKLGVTAVVEIPAGTARKMIYDSETNRFIQEQDSGKPRMIRFLPYPANYGFIPSTSMDPSAGGDGDALDVVVLTESLPTGTVLAVRPVAALLLKDGGELDTKIIAIPVDTVQQLFIPADFQDFMLRYDGARSILENWFFWYKGLGETEVIGWRDEAYARKEIERWRLPTQ